MHKFLIFALISSLSISTITMADNGMIQNSEAASQTKSSSLSSDGKTQSSQTSNEATDTKKADDSDNGDKADITSIAIPPITDEGRDIKGCKYLGDDEATGYDKYECFDKEMHGVNIASGGKCQSYFFNNNKTKYYCLSDIVRGGRSLVMHCSAGWKYIKPGKPDVVCKTKAVDTKKKATDDDPSSGT